MNGYERIRALAHVSIGRACLYGLVAIVAMMIGLIGRPDIALRAGAILFLLTSAFLVLRAVQALNRSYRETEVWALLGKRHDLPEPGAQAIFGEVLRGAYLKFARLTMVASVLLWAAEQTLTLAGVVPS